MFEASHLKMPGTIDTEFEKIATIVQHSTIDNWYNNPAFNSLVIDDHPDLDVWISYYSVRIFIKKDLDEILGKLQCFLNYDMRVGSLLTTEEAQHLRMNCDQDDLRSVIATVRKLSREQLECLGV